MSPTIKTDTPPSPVEWGKPEERASPQAPKPEESFVDDELVARQKGQESSRQRALGDPGLAARPQFVADLGVKVPKTSAFRPAEEDAPETHRAKKRGESAGAAVSRGAIGARKQGRRGGATQAGAGAAAAEEAAENLPDTARAGRQLERLAEWADKLCDLERQQARSAQVLPPQDLQAQVAAQSAQRQRLEASLRFALQDLLAGGIGFVLLADPRQTLDRLWRLWRRWPRSVRPGHRPQSEADCDAFLAWIFEPPPLPADLQ